MKTSYKNWFRLVFGLCIAAIVCLVLVYRFVFNGGFSEDGNDWIAFATFVGSLGTMLFTGLNVCVFYHLTTAMAEQEYTTLKQKKQCEIYNRFTNNINALFELDKDGSPTCEIREANYLRVNDWFKNIKRHSTLLSILGSKEYETFTCKLADFFHYYGLYDDDITVFDGKTPEEAAYYLYMEGREISFKMLDEIASI